MSFELRELCQEEINNVHGGDGANSASALYTAWSAGQDFGNYVYNNMTPAQQDAVGGTIYEMVNMDLNTFTNYWSNVGQQFANYIADYYAEYYSNYDPS